MLQTGCINPLFFDDVGPPSNHAPVVINMRPAPSFRRLELNVGVNCAPLVTFFPDFVDDPDLDVLSLRWSLLVETAGFEGGGRIRLREEDMVPLEEPVDGSFYAFTPFQMSREVVLTNFVPLPDPENPVEGQLLELIISDRGFKAGRDNIPDDGAGVFYMSWAVRLTDESCGVLP